MGLSVGPLDVAAFTKIGGPLDDMSDASQWVIEGLKTADDGREPNNGKFGKRVAKANIAQKIFSYSRKAYELIDEKSRDGAILKIGVDIALDVVGKLLGQSLSTHPYYAYHKAMLDYLASALDAHRNAREAIAQYRKAVSAAMSKALADEFKGLESRKVEISAAYSGFKDTVGIAVDISRGVLSPKMIRQRVQQYGKIKILQSLADLETWRIAWTGLAFDGLKLQIMAQGEFETARVAMKKVAELVDDLMKGNSLKKVNGQGARNHIEWEKYDQIVNKGVPQGAVMDPVKFAQGNVEKATAWAQEFSAMCDFARSSEAIYPTKYNMQLEKLNKVLCG